MVATTARSGLRAARIADSRSTSRTHMALKEGSAARAAIPHARPATARSPSLAPGSAQPLLRHPLKAAADPTANPRTSLAPAGPLLERRDQRRLPIAASPEGSPVTIKMKGPLLFPPRLMGRARRPRDMRRPPASATPAARRPRSRARGTPSSATARSPVPSARRMARRQAARPRRPRRCGPTVWWTRSPRADRRRARFPGRAFRF